MVTVTVTCNVAKVVLFAGVAVGIIILASKISNSGDAKEVLTKVADIGGGGIGDAA